MVVISQRWGLEVEFCFCYIFFCLSYIEKAEVRQERRVGAWHAAKGLRSESNPAHCMKDSALVNGVPTLPGELPGAHKMEVLRQRIQANLVVSRASGRRRTRHRTRHGMRKYIWVREWRGRQSRVDGWPLGNDLCVDLRASITLGAATSTDPSPRLSRLHRCSSEPSSTGANQKLQPL